MIVCFFYKSGKKAPKLPIAIIIALEIQSCFLMTNISQRRKMNKGHTTFLVRTSKNVLLQERRCRICSYYIFWGESNLQLHQTSYDIAPSLLFLLFRLPCIAQGHHREGFGSSESAIFDGRAHRFLSIKLSVIKIPFPISAVTSKKDSHHLNLIVNISSSNCLSYKRWDQDFWKSLLHFFSLLSAPFI